MFINQPNTIIINLCQLIYQRLKKKEGSSHMIFDKVSNSG